MWSVKLSKRAIKDKELLKGAGLAEKTKIIIELKYRGFAIHITQRVKIHINSTLHPTKNSSAI